MLMNSGSKAPKGSHFLTDIGKEAVDIFSLVVPIMGRNEAQRFKADPGEPCSLWSPKHSIKILARSHCNPEEAASADTFQMHDGEVTQREASLGFDFLATWAEPGLCLVRVKNTVRVLLCSRLLDPPHCMLDILCLVLASRIL